MEKSYVCLLVTLSSQAYGAREHELCCTYLQRSRILVALQLVWTYCRLVSMIAANHAKASMILMVMLDPSMATKIMLV
mgnify:CR=1 FL=1